MNDCRFPLVSVITPTYNSEKYIRTVYSCLLNQTCSDWEWLVTDDSSIDDTPKILRQLAKNDSRLKLKVLEFNSGAAVARNFAIENASGRFIAFLDADDEWLPEKLEKQIFFMIENKYSFTHCWYQPIDNQGNKIGPVLKAPRKMNYYDMLKFNQVGCLTAVYDTQKLGKVYMPSIRKRQDYGLWLNLLKKTPYVYCLPECMAQYRNAPGSISSNKFEMLKYHWHLFREIEKFSLAKSIYYLGWNILGKLKK